MDRQHQPEYQLGPRVSQNTLSFFIDEPSFFKTGSMTDNISPEL